MMMLMTKTNHFNRSQNPFQIKILSLNQILVYRRRSNKIKLLKMMKTKQFRISRFLFQRRLLNLRRHNYKRNCLLLSRRRRLFLSRRKSLLLSKTINLLQSRRSNLLLSRRSSLLQQRRRKQKIVIKYRNKNKLNK